MNKREPGNRKVFDAQDLIFERVDLGYDPDAIKLATPEDCMHRLPDDLRQPTDLEQVAKEIFAKYFPMDNDGLNLDIPTANDSYSSHSSSDATS
jgi:hypothetical protein